MKADAQRELKTYAPKPVEDDANGTLLRNLLPVETNTAAACVVLGTAQAVDALMARGSTAADADAPASLRMTCIVLIACAASPPIREYIAFGQRGVASALLFVVSLLADHRNGLYARVADGACALGIVLLLLFFFTIGPMHIASKDATHCVQRDVFCALPAALMVHVGSRSIRMAFAHPWDSKGVRVGVEPHEQREVGYAFASTESSAVLAFGGAIVIGTGALLLSSNSVKESGSAAAASAMVVSAGMQAAAAFAVMLAQARQLTSLPALFGASACDDRDLCAAAFESRRNVLVTTGSSTLWLAAFATIVMAYAPSLRSRSAETRSMHGGGAPYAVGTLGFAVWRLAVNLPFEGDGSTIEWCGLVALIAVATSAYVETWLGLVLFGGALGYDLVDDYLRLGIKASTFQPTDSFVYCNIVMLIFYVLVAATYNVVSEQLAEKAARFFDVTLTSLAALGTSSAMILYILSASCTAAASGALFTDAMFGDQSDARFFREAVRFAMKHYLPLLVWLVPYAEECSAPCLGRVTPLVLHFVGGVVPVLLYAGVAIYASVASDDHDDKNTAYVPYLADTPALLLGVACSTVAWSCLAFA